MSKSYDLSTSSKWAALSDGDHNITIVAKADGYRDSEPSSAVVVTKSTTPTEDELAGTWVFNNTINFSALSTEDEFDFSWIVNYNVSDDSRDFVQMDTNRMSREDEEGNPILGGNINYIPYSTGIQEPIVAYQFEGDLSMWGSDSYKTIAITSKLSEVTNGDTLLKWLRENATKQ